MALTELTENDTPGQLSYRLNVYIKKLEYVRKFKNKIENTQKPYYLARIGLIPAKTRKKSHARVPLSIFQDSVW